MRHIDQLELHTRLAVVGRQSRRFYHRRRLAVGNHLGLLVHRHLAVVAHKDHVELVVRRSLGRGLVVGRDFVAEDRENGIHRIADVFAVAYKGHAVVSLHMVLVHGSAAVDYRRNRKSLGWTCSCRMTNNLDR